MSNDSIKSPFKSQADVKVTRKPPAGAKVVKGLGSAYKTIQTLTGAPPAFLLTLDMGAFDVHIKRDGKIAKIKYKRDVKTKTRSDISLAGVRLKD